MYYFNKIVAGFLNPLGIGMLLIILPLVWNGACALRKRTMRARPFPPIYFLIPFFWLWFWSCGVADRLVALPLEREFPPQLVEALPKADAIVLLGGGMGSDTNVCPYAEMYAAADRPWHAARLYKAGKASRIFVTMGADAMLLSDFGVPKDAIVPPTGARNTEEEARLVGERLGPSKILLVTSSWHMRRAKLMFERYAKDVTVVAAATDHESTLSAGEGLKFSTFMPDPVVLGYNAYRFKEWLAYCAYKWFRN